MEQFELLSELLETFSHIDDRLKGLEDRVKKLEEKTKRKSSPSFVKPTMDEAADYHEEKQYTFNLVTWYDYYETNGWQVGRTKMKDWKACMRTWQNREPKHGVGSVPIIQNKGDWM